MPKFALILFALLVMTCGPTESSRSADKAILGTWKLMGMTKEPFPLEKITETDMIGGIMIFKEDQTFEGEIVYPKTPDKNLKVSGTYTVENSKLTIKNQTNNSTTRSSLKFERDFMIATPETEGGFIAYYKRAS